VILTPPLQKLSGDTGDIHKVILPGAGVFWCALQTNPICHLVLSSHRASFCLPPDLELFCESTSRQEMFRMQFSGKKSSVNTFFGVLPLPF